MIRANKLHDSRHLRRIYVEDSRGEQSLDGRSLLISDRNLHLSRSFRFFLKLISCHVPLLIP